MSFVEIADAMSGTRTPYKNGRAQLNGRGGLVLPSGNTASRLASAEDGDVQAIGLRLDKKTEALQKRLNKIGAKIKSNTKKDEETSKEGAKVSKEGAKASKESAKASKDTANNKSTAENVISKSKVNIDKSKDKAEKDKKTKINEEELESKVRSLLRRQLPGQSAKM